MALPRYLMTNAYGGKAFAALLAAQPDGSCPAYARNQLDTGSPRLLTTAAGMTLRSRILSRDSLLGSMAAPCRALTYTGIVVDAVTEKPIEGAIVTFGDRVATTDVAGAFHAEGDGGPLRVRAVGHRRSDIAAERLNGSMPPIALTLLLKPKAGCISLVLRDREIDTLQGRRR